MKIKNEPDKDTIDWIFIAKGLGIFFVVVGHFHPASSPFYWTEIRKIIYSFHMPLFFLLSGYLYNRSKYSYHDLIMAKLKRLLYPFISIAVMFFLIKYISGHIVNIDHPVNISSIYALLLDPVKSYMPLLWFVHALFLIFLIYPLLRIYMNNFVILSLLVIANAILGSDFLLFGKALSNMPFFIVGIIIREKPELSKKIISSNFSYILITLFLFCSLYTAKVAFTIPPYYKYLTSILLGVIGSLLTIDVSHSISNFSNKITKDLLIKMGYYSMTIYLFHTLFESTVRIGFLQIFKKVQLPFEMIAIVAVFCGVIFPLLLEKEVLRKYAITKKFILGIS